MAASPRGENAIALRRATYVAEREKDGEITKSFVFLFFCFFDFTKLFDFFVFLILQNFLFFFVFLFFTKLFDFFVFLILQNFLIFLFF